MELGDNSIYPNYFRLCTLTIFIAAGQIPEDTGTRGRAGGTGRECIAG